jgi:ABC-type bacteriocin/lantibiotic exporter with double-glycine peptidase domain
MVLMIPINSFVATQMKKYQIAQMTNKDKRVKLMDEVLNGIKVLKLYAWEPSFLNKLIHIREEEINAVKKVMKIF